MSTHITPIEAVTSRLNEVPFKHGNVIFDSQGKTIYYDSITEDRIEISSVIFVDAETIIKDRIIKGIENKLYICRDTGSVYYSSNDMFLPVLSKKLAKYTDFYVSPTGTYDNDGLSKDSPLGNINDIFNKYPDSNDVTIHLEPGKYTYMDARGIGYVKIIGDINGATSIDYLTIDSCSFYMTNISCININATSSKGIISNCLVKANKSFGISLHNSNLFIENTEINDASIALVLDRNSFATIVDLEGSNDNIAYSVANGSILNVLGELIKYKEMQYILATLGKIYFVGQPTDVKTKEYIDSQLQDLHEDIENKFDTINFGSLQEVNNRLDKIEQTQFITAWQVDELFEMFADTEWTEAMMVLSMSTTILTPELDAMFSDSGYIATNVPTNKDLEGLKLSLASPIYQSELEMLFDEDNTSAYIVDNSIVVPDDINSVAIEAVNSSRLSDEELRGMFA